MKVISIGTDRKLFEEGSGVRLRMVEYGKIFEELHIIVFSLSNTKEVLQKQQIAENVFIYPTNSKNKLLYVLDAIKIAKNILEGLRFKLEGREGVILSSQDPFETGLVGLFLKLAYRLPLQIQLHTDFTNRYFITHSILNFVRFPIGIFVLSFADSVRVVSQRIFNSIVSLSHNVSILPVYSKIENKNVKRSESNIVNFLTVCRLAKEKDLQTVIFALKKVLDKGVDCQFTIVGDGSEKSSLQKLCQKLGLEERVIFTGWKNDLEEYYKNADIYISTSLYEGYGMSTVEAASFGLPLIISDTGVAGSLFLNEKEALVCKQKNVDEFADAMFRLVSDKELREKMGLAAKKAVEIEEITFDKYLQEYKNSLESALSFNDSGHNVFKKNILLRYLVAGVTAASTNIGLLYIFTDILRIHYLYSSILSFVIAISVSFTLQKFWTFNDKKIDGAHYQFAGYMMVALLGILINTLSMYLMVELFNVWYILAQVITGVLIAIFNFFMYKFFIFNRN